MSESPVSEGDRFEGPGGTEWTVTDPWDEIEQDGVSVPFVWLSAVDHPEEGRGIGVAEFADMMDDGDFEEVTE